MHPYAQPYQPATDTAEYDEDLYDADDVPALETWDLSGFDVRQPLHVES